MERELRNAAKRMLGCDLKLPQYEHIILTDEERTTALNKEITRQARIERVPVAAITLTSEQTDEALRVARRAKDGILKEQEYFARLQQPRQYPKYTTRQLAEYFILKASEHLRRVKGDPSAIYKVTDHNRSILNKLCQYFADDPAFESGDYSLSKGIMLIGPVGCGKTFMMKMFSSNPKASFSVIGCQAVSYEYAKDGIEAVMRHSAIKRCPDNRFGQDELATLFDDLGADTERKHYGDRVNAMNEILESRYRLERHSMTHLTTNLDGPGIEEYYGLRTRSRCREMFNTFIFDTHSPDLRK